MPDGDSGSTESDYIIAGVVYQSLSPRLPPTLQSS